MSAREALTCQMSLKAFSITENMEIKVQPRKMNPIPARTPFLALSKSLSAKPVMTSMASWFRGE